VLVRQDFDQENQEVQSHESVRSQQQASAAVDRAGHLQRAHAAARRPRRIITVNPARVFRLDA
jgi:hypothetical protein